MRPKTPQAIYQLKVTLIGSKQLTCSLMPILWVEIEMHNGTDTNSIPVYSVKPAIRKSIKQTTASTF